MGRLFWKFFVFLWLAQLVTSVGVGVTIWLLRPEHGPARFDHPLPPAAFADAPRPLAPPARGEPRSHPPGPLEMPPPPPRSLLPPLMPIFAGSIVSLIFAALLAAYFARPIRNLRAAFESVAEGRLETRVAATMGRRKDELAELGVGFDRMAERLQTLLEGQRRLLHDVSHELRSPLARLQAAADLLRQQPDRSAVFVERIERDTNRMDELVGELLTLARVDAGMSGRLDEKVDLQEIIADIAEDARLESAARQCAIELAIADAPVVPGNPGLIRRAVENVLRNAVRHSPEGGRIHVSAQPEANRDWVRIEIADQGPGVPEADLDAIFEPFFRSEPADPYAGYGLGLTITRRVIESHGGTVSAANRVEGGFVLRILLPTGMRSS